MQGSTAGYFAHLYIENVAEALGSPEDFPAMFDGVHYVYQGELDITAQIELGGKGQYVDGRDASRNWDSTSGSGKVTFEDVDGLEVYQSEGDLYAIIQEDSGNRYGERMFITKLEHENDGNELPYYFVAMSGGSRNSRMAARVSIPSGSSCGGGSHEFSSQFDLSGLLYKTELGSFALSASDDGFAKRKYDNATTINDKYIMTGLQAHNMQCGLIAAVQSDRGGQILVYNPNIPV